MRWAPTCCWCRQRRQGRFLRERVAVSEGVFATGLACDPCAEQYADDGWFVLTIAPDEVMPCVKS